MPETLQSFPPIIADRCRVLILGSMPGIHSLEKGQYYAHPRNQFWKILGAVFEETIPESYSGRKAFLLEKQVALWDVIASCQRKGSLDTAIQKERPNDLKSLLRQYPGIRWIGFNGLKAHQTFRAHMGVEIPGVTCCRLPSTSPAHTMAFEEKRRQWTKLLEGLKH